MARVFFRLFAVNLALLSMYLVLSYLEWNRWLDFPLVALINWTLLRTEVWFGGTVPVILDGHFWIDHWSFVTVLVMIVANLAAIWNIEHVKKS
ncbi:hypothetical protein MUP77_15915 [Candidatus Bathyarchaeota archaeon]|nr:hypothetical protein [Candidatus Bathyarchaeota archaeon]